MYSERRDLAFDEEWGFNSQGEEFYSEVCRKI